MLVKCPHCHADFLVDEQTVKNQHGLVVDEIASCPKCLGVVSLIDTASSSDPNARSTPWSRQLSKRWGAGLARLIPAKLKRLAGGKSATPQIVALSVMLLLMLLLLYLQGAFGHLSFRSAKSGGALSVMSERDEAASAALAYVRNRIQTPRLATFPPLYEVNVKDIGGNYLKVNSWVEECDLLGNRNRTPFVCTLKRIQSKHYALDKMVIGSENPKTE